MTENIRVLVPQQQFDNQQLELIRKTVAKGTTPEQFLLFIEVCKHYRLNPMARQIYAVVRGGNMTIQTSIDGFRLLSERSGKYAGMLGPQWCGTNGEWQDVWLKDEPPTAARVGILRKDFEHPIWGIAKYKSYVQPSSPLWTKMPDTMLAKCAESLARRIAFPAEMSGLYTTEEMAQADNHDAPGPMVEIREQTEEDKKKSRLNEIFKAGKAKGLFGNKGEMAEYISAGLNQEITADGIASLDDTQLWALEQVIEGAQEMAQAS
jgi:phage recombination protein Bet